jgi:hypothetical protein
LIRSLRSKLARFLLFFCQSQLDWIIRAHLGNLTRYAHPFRAAFGTLSRFARLWLVSPQLRSARSLLRISYAWAYSA